MSEKVKQAVNYCNKFGQEHLAEYLKPVYSERARTLAEQIVKIDIDQINKLYEELGTISNHDSGDGEISPINTFDKTSAGKKELEMLLELGYDSLKKGEVAAITMAGGQGTRLGHDGPKGTFILDCTPPKSLFRIQCDSLLDIKEKTGIFIPWLIMTSHENHLATKKHFEENDYFGYDKVLIRFFAQGMLPMIDLNGEILVRENNIAVGPDGNGGIFASLEKSGNLEWLKSIGVKRVFVCGIDNVLVKVADPEFIGFSIVNYLDIACKSSLKRKWDENAGIYCMKNNRASYLEYTEISKQKAKELDDDGNFVFGDIGIVMYVYTIELLDKIAKKKLPFHIAKKKIPYSTIEGELIEPTIPNGIKFETFIFDSFIFADKVSIMRVDRDLEFAPIKNKSGEDSPSIALELYEKSQRIRNENGK